MCLKNHTLVCHYMFCEKKNNMNIPYRIYFLLLMLAISMASCLDFVDEGIEIDYLPSNATLMVEPIASDNGAVNETVSYKITAQSTANIKSCIVQATNEGKGGSGYNVSTTDFDDPFIDHIFGTIQKDVQSFTVRYDYVIPEGISRTRLTFTLIDETGKVSTEATVEVVPTVTHYLGRSIYAKDKIFYDAFSTVDGEVYPNIKDNYSTFSAENVAVQEKLDFLFYYDRDSKRSVIAAPISGAANLILNINNKTSLKKMTGLEELDISKVTASQLVSLTADANLLKEGSTQIYNLKVGDVISFITDLNAVFALKTGLLKVTGLHPINIDRYEGLAFVLECDVVVQQ